MAVSSACPRRLVSSRVVLVSGEAQSDRVDAIAAVVARLEADLPSTGRQLDGIGGSGKTLFASNLAARVTSRAVVILHVDDFFNPPEVRHARGRHSPEGFWLDTYDYNALIENALEPLRAGREQYRAAPAAPHSTATEDALVLVEGTFLLRDLLLGYWNSSVYLSVPFAVAAARMAERGTVTDAIEDPRIDSYFGAQRLYFLQASPWKRASIVVDNTDWTRPQLLDGCVAPAD